MILMIESSTEFLRMWLAGRDGGEVSKKEISLGREMSSRILSEIRGFLRDSGFDWRDLAGVAVFAGPGSFTGVRIGVTVANTLADALEIPIVGASNSDFSKVDDGGVDDWREIAISKLRDGENHKVAEVFYARPANITKQKK